MKSVQSLPDFNPISDEGAPTSSGGIQNATELADALGAGLHLTPAEQRYFVGWGDRGADAEPFLYKRTFTLNDINSTPTKFPFDLVNGQSPIFIGLDQEKYCITLNNNDPLLLNLQ